jgi:putative DNA primase/helicase
LAENFGLAPLIGKRAAIISDARLGGRADQHIIAERLLSISGEDRITIDRKYREPWTGRLPVRFFILSNELPRLADASGAPTSRLILLMMQRRFYGREDLGLDNELSRELPGILNWSLAGLDRLNLRGHFVPPKSSAEALGDLEDLTSPTGAFIRECCVVAPDKTASMEEMYSRWESWCRVNNRLPGTAQTFGRDLRAAVSGLTTWRPRGAAPERKRVYWGIGLSTSQMVREGPRLVVGKLLIYNGGPLVHSKPNLYAKKEIDKRKEREENNGIGRGPCGPRAPGAWEGRRRIAIGR